MSIGIHNDLLKNIAGNPEGGFFSYDKGNENEGRLLGKLDGKDIYLVPVKLGMGDIQDPANKEIREKFLNAAQGEDLMKDNAVAMDQIRRNLGLKSDDASEAQKPLKAFGFAKILKGVEDFAKWKNLYETEYKNKGYTFEQFSKALDDMGVFKLDGEKPKYGEIKSITRERKNNLKGRLDNVVNREIVARLGTERELRECLGLPAEGDANGAQPKAMELLNKLNAFRNKTKPADLKALQELKSEFVEYQAEKYLKDKAQDINQVIDDSVNELMSGDMGKNFAGVENLKERMSRTFAESIKQKVIETLTGDFEDFHTAPDAETLEKALDEAKSPVSGLWTKTMSSIYDNFKDQGLYKVVLEKILKRSDFPNPNLAELFGKSKEVCGDLLTALLDDKNVAICSLLAGFGKLSENIEKYMEKYNSITGISQKIDSEQAMKDLVSLGLLSSGKAFVPSKEGKKVLATCCKEMEKYVYAMTAQSAKYKDKPQTQKILDNAQKEWRLLKSFAKLVGIPEKDYAFDIKPDEKLIGNADVERYLESRGASIFHLTYLGDLQKKDCAEVGKGYVDFINKQLAEVPRNAQDRKYVDFSQNMDKVLGHDGITWKKGDAVIERTRQEDTAGVPQQIKDFFAKDQLHGAQASYALGTILNQDQLAEMKKLQKETKQPFSNDFTAENPTLDFKVRRMQDGSYQIETKLFASLKTLEDKGKEMQLDPANSRITYTSLMKLTFDQNGNPKLEMLKPTKVDFKLVPSPLPADALKRLNDIKDPLTNEPLAKNALWDKELLGNPKLVDLLGKKDNDKDIVEFLKKHAITADDEAYLVGSGISQQEMEHLIHGIGNGHALSSKLAKDLRNEKREIREAAWEKVTELRQELRAEGWLYPQILKPERGILSLVGGVKGSYNSRFSDLRLLWDYMDTKDSGFNEELFRHSVLDKLLDKEHKVREEGRRPLQAKISELRREQGMKYLYFFSKFFAPSDVALLENASTQEDKEAIGEAMNAIYNATNVYDQKEVGAPLGRLLDLVSKLRGVGGGQAAHPAEGAKGANPLEDNLLNPSDEIMLDLREEGAPDESHDNLDNSINIDLNDSNN